MDLHHVIKYGKHGFVNDFGDEVIPCIYNDAGDCREEPFAVQDINGKWGFFDKAGNAITAFKYDAVEEFRLNRAIVYVGDKCAIIDNHGKELTDFIFCGIQGYYWHDIVSFVVAIDEKKVGAVDENGKYIILPEFDYVFIDPSGYYWFRKDGRYGLTNSAGEIIIEPIFDLCSYHHGLIKIGKNGKIGCLDLDGNEIVPLEYEDIKALLTNYKSGSWRVMAVTQNSKLGLLKKDGQMIAPCIFDEIELLDGAPQFFRVKIKRKGWGLYDSDGNELLPCKYQEISNLKLLKNHETPCFPISIKQKGKYGTYDPYERKMIEKCIHSEKIL